MSGIKKIRFGSAPDNDVVIDKPGVAPHHAEVSWDGRALMLRDLASGAGTTLNGQPVQTLQVRVGDIVGLGGHAFKLSTAHLPGIETSPGVSLPMAPGTAALPQIGRAVEPPGAPARKTMFESAEQISQSLPSQGSGEAARASARKTMLQPFDVEATGAPGKRTMPLEPGGDEASKRTMPLESGRGDTAGKRTMLQPVDAADLGLGGGAGEARRTVMQSVEDLDLSALGASKAAAGGFSVVVIPPGSVSISVGYDGGNDVVIPVAQVAATHCRLWRGAGILVIDDLGSSAGTFVNGERVDRAVVTPEDRIELGTYRLVLSEAVLAHFEGKRPGEDRHGQSMAPSGAKRRFKIGRDPEPGVNDIVIDAPMVSNEHCELNFDGHNWHVRDLGSTNGTFVNTTQRRVSASIVTPSDVLFFGTYRFPAARLRDYLEDASGHKANELSMPEGKAVMIVGRDEGCDITIDAPQVSRRHARLRRGAGGLTIEDLGSANGTFVNGHKVTRPTPIGPNDEVGLGSYQLRFDLATGTVASTYKGDIMLQASEVTIKVDRGRKTILHGVSFTVYPTEFVGLMGPSGAGKTTLMMALNGYLPPSSGQSLINGQELYANYDAFRGNIGYVPQDDIIHSELTVWEALFYTALLRLPPDTTRKEIGQIIEGVLEQLEITQTKDVLIGSPAKKGISGGQRKRVNLAQELITRPSLLFLDEPTSGLASEDTINVMKLLRRLADDGRTILLTIHQPSLEAYRTMDNIVYLADGHLVYYGPSFPDSITFFNPGVEQGTPEGDLILSDPGNALKPLAEDKRKRRDMSERARAYAQSTYHSEYVVRRRESGASAVALSAGSKKKTSRRFGLGQWWVLTRRYFTIKRKDVANTLILFIQAPVIAGIIAGVFSGKTDDVFDKIAYTPMALFLMAISAIWFGCSNSAREIVGELAIYRRERMVNLKIPSYIMSKFTVLGFICALQCAMLLGIVDLFLGFGAVWGWLYFFLVLCSLAGVGMGLLLSALVATPEAAIALVPLLLIPQVILGGLIMPIGDMKSSVMKGLTVPMVARWGFEGMLHAETYPGTFRISDIKKELKEQEIFDELEDKRCIGEFKYEEPDKPVEKYFPDHKATKSEVGDIGVLLGFNLMLLLGIVVVMKVRDPES